MGLLNGLFSARKSMPITGIGSHNSVGVRPAGHSRVRTPSGHYSISKPLPERADEVHSRRYSWRFGSDRDEGLPTEAETSKPSTPSSSSSAHRQEGPSAPTGAIRNPSKDRYVPLRKPRLVGSKHGASSSVSVTKPSSSSSSSPKSPPSTRQTDARHRPTRSVRGFVDLLDARDEIRPSDFRSRVQATGARDYGEDVAERNMGQNGTDLSSPSVLEFYSKTGGTVPSIATVGATPEDSAKLLGARSDLALRRLRPLGLASSRGSRSFASIASIAEGAGSEPDEPSFVSSSSARPSFEAHRRRSAAALASSASSTTSSSHASRGPRRSRPPSMIRTDLAPFSALANITLVPPAIPAHTPPVSPRSLRDSVVLAKEKQTSTTSPLARTHMAKSLRRQRAAASDDENSDAEEASAPPPCIRRESRVISMTAFDPDTLPSRHHHHHDADDGEPPRGRTLTRAWPYSPAPSPAAFLQPDDLDDAALPPSIQRHWSFSSTTPTTASTCLSTPYSMFRPQSRHTADTSIEEDDDDLEVGAEADDALTVSPSCRTSASSLGFATGGDGPTPLCCTAVEARVILPNVVPSASAHSGPPVRGGDFTLDDYYPDSDDVDSMYSFDDRREAASVGAKVPATPRTRRREEDADLLFRNGGYGKGGSQQIPGLFEDIGLMLPATATTTPRQAGRPSSLATVSAATMGARVPDASAHNTVIGISGMIRSVFEHSDSEEDLDGEEEDVEAELANNTTAANAVQAQAKAKVDARAALRLRKQAKTLARLTGTLPPRRCAADMDSDSGSDGHDDNDEQEDGGFF